MLIFINIVSLTYQMVLLYHVNFRSFRSLIISSCLLFCTPTTHSLEFSLESLIINMMYASIRSKIYQRLSVFCDVFSE